MEVKLSINSRDSVYLLTGADLHSLSMILDLKPLKNHSLECLTKVSFTETQDSLTGVVL